MAGGSGEKDIGRVAKSGKGSGASIYAPKPNAEEKSESTSVAAQRPGTQGSTSTAEIAAPAPAAATTASTAPAPTTSAAPAASTPAVKASEDGWFSAATPSSPARTPQTPARKRGVPGSPAPARTPLSESAPLPETPLKHDRRREQGRSGRGAAAAGAGGTASLRQTIADRRNVPLGHTFTTPDREWSQQPSAGVATPPANPANAPRGLGLGLTPTKATPSSSQFGGPLPSPSLSKVTTSESTAQAAPSSPKPAGAADQIESMLLRLRGAKSKTGSSASRWATADDVQQAQQQPERSSGLDQATEPTAQSLDNPPQLRSPPPPSPRPEQEAFSPHVPQQQEEPGSPSMASLTSSTEPQPLRQEFLAPSSATHRSKTMRRTSSARSDTTVKAGDDEPQSESFDGSVDAGETVEASGSVDVGETVDADESLATSETAAADDSLANVSTESVIDSANQSQHFDWADDDELEDSLPDLDDWGITVPESPATSPEKLPAPAHAPSSPALSSSSSSSPSKSRSRPPAKPRRDLFAQAMQEGRVPTGPKSQRDNRARPVDGDWKAARAATFAAEQAAEQKRAAKSGGGKSRNGAHAARESPAPRSGAASSADDGVGIRIAGTAAKNQGKELLPSSPRQRGGGGGGDKKGKSGQSGRKKAESGPRA